MPSLSEQFPIMLPLLRMLLVLLGLCFLSLPVSEVRHRLTRAHRKRDAEAPLPRATARRVPRARPTREP